MAICLVERDLRKLLWEGELKARRKRVRLTPAQRIHIWEHPETYGRTCSICLKKITKISDLELDHTKPHSKGGTTLRLAHRECNRMKSSGSLGKIQKALGIKTPKKRASKKAGKVKRRKHKTPLEKLTKQIQKDF